MSAARRRAEALAFKRSLYDAVEKPFPVLDATQIDTPSNSDEALALFALYVTEGDRISLHSEFCRTHISADNECSCTPTELLVGARA